MLGTEVGKDETHMFVLSFVYPHIVKTANEIINQLVRVLGVFAKLRKATVNFVTSVRPSARM
jgi:hypothetical protein